MMNHYEGYEYEEINGFHFHEAICLLIALAIVASVFASIYGCVLK